MAGNPLLRGVSFKLERRDRLTLSGRNGSGKTTLLRMLAGETSVDGGQLAFAKDTRVALHDQRPPRDRDLSLRDYVLGGCGDLLALEARLAELEQAMAEGAIDAGDARRLRAARRRGSSTPAATTGARASTRRCTGSASATRTSTATLATFSGGELTRASLARALAGDPDLLLLDEPTNHLDIAVARVARDAPAVARRRRRARRARPLVPRGGRHRGARARGRARALLQGHLARVAQGEGGARAGARPRDREAGGGDRRARALRHALPRGHARAPGAVAREAAARRSSGSSATRATARRSASRSSRPSAPGRVVFEVEDGELRIGDRVLLRRRRAVARARRARHARRPERHRQDDADPRARRRARARPRQAAPRPQRQARRALPARRGARLDRHRARGVPARDGAEAERGARAARPLPVQRRGGREAARRAVGRRAPAALARGARAAPARTC